MQQPNSVATSTSFLTLQGASFHKVRFLLLPLLPRTAYYTRPSSPEQKSSFAGNPTRTCTAETSFEVHAALEFPKQFNHGLERTSQGRHTATGFSGPGLSFDVLGNSNAKTGKATPFDCASVVASPKKSKVAFTHTCQGCLTAAGFSSPLQLWGLLGYDATRRLIFNTVSLTGRGNGIA